MPLTELELLKLAEKFFDGDIDITKIWLKKYGINGESPQDIWKRIAKLCSEVEDEKKQKKWEEEFFEILKDFKFIPGGRILFGLTEQIKEEKKRKITLSNCFFLNPPEDNLESIMNVGYKMAKTYAHGGGCGVDLSLIRPKNSKVNNSAIVSDGVMPFMEMYSGITGTIAISGRRGALLLSLECFSKNTEVLTDMGWVNIIELIDKIQQGIEINAIDENGITNKIINPIVNEKNEIYEIETEDGTKLEVTSTHQFEVKNLKTNKVYLKRLCDINPEIEMLKIIREDLS